MKRIILILLLALIPNLAIAGETYWVASGGSQTNCTTIQTEGTPAGDPAVAINCANASGAANGDIVKIKAGTYTNSITPFASCSSPVTTFPSGTSFTDALTVQADTGATVIIQPGSGSSACGALWVSSKSYLKFQDIIFDGTDVGSAQAVATLSASDHIRFTRVHFRDSVTFSGLFSNTTSHFNEFIDSHAYNNGTNFGDHGLYITGSDNTIDGGEYWDNAGYGIHIFNSSSSTTTNRNTVKNALIYANGTDTANGSCGVIVSAGDANKVYNNFIYEHSSAQSFNCGILVGVAGSPSSNAEIYNNTIVNNGNGTGYQINIQSVASGTIVRNNIAIEPGAGDGLTIFNGGSGSSLSHNSETDSTTGYFVNVGTDDYHLVDADSPAFGTGTPLTLFSTDIDDEERPQGAAWDRGADEFTSPPEGVSLLSPNDGGDFEVGSILSITWTSVGLGGANQSQTFNADGTWTSPITGNVQVDVWGAGGGGGGNSSNADGGGGGGGGAFSRETSQAVTATTGYTIEVGTAGAGGVGANAGSAGGDSYFNSSGTVMAKGGAGGGTPIAGAAGLAGAGGASASGVGDTKFSGGSGGAGNNNNAGAGGGGGGSAGLTSVGGTGGTAVTAAGAAGTAGTGSPAGAAGGAGGNNTPSPGSVPGGGGGGAGDPDNGAAGAAGRVIVYWTEAGTVDIELSRNNGSSWETLANDTADDGSFDWTVAGATTVAQGLIRITHQGGGGETDTSDTPFSISADVTPTITVTSPVDGQAFRKGVSIPVGWDSTDVSGNVRIDVSWDNGGTWSTAIASTPFDSSAQNWITTTPASSTCKVRVVSLNDTNIVGTMTGNFRIRGSRTGDKQ